MAEGKPANKRTRKARGFTEVEKSAMRQRVKELQAGKVDGEEAVLERIAAMEPPDRAMAKRIHALIKGIAPGLSPKLWYGMPAYAKDGKIICHFQDAKKFKTRYSTLGFSDSANLDEGVIWPVAFALKELTADAEARIGAIVKKAVG